MPLAAGVPVKKPKYDDKIVFIGWILYIST